MPSIFEIPIQETGGPDAQAGFEYQHRIGVSELLQMAIDPCRELIEFDSHDDILVRFNRPTGVIAEFVQVKGRASGIWTPSDLYADEKPGVLRAQRRLYSLVAKQLRRAIGDDHVTFRVVTSTDTNTKLAVLKKPADSRKAAEISALKSKLHPLFSHLEFPGGRTVGDWIDLMQWEFAGVDQSVDNRNLRLIAEGVFELNQRTLAPLQAQALYSQLLARVRQASAISGTRAGKSCTRQELLSWLDDFCARQPVHLAPDVRQLLESLQADAHHRCISRWRAAGVPASLAQELAEDELVGRSAVLWIKEQPEDFLWISGQFGAGKSLAVDRVFQDVLRDYLAGRQTRIPIFLEAKAMLRPLAEEIDAAASKFGHHRRDGVHVIIDGADERTLQRARELVHEAAAYSGANPRSRILVTSSILEVPGHKPRMLPPLPRNEARQLLDRLTASQSFSFHPLDGRFSADFENPLFIILCARFGVSLSRAELVRRLVTAALERVETAIFPAEELLTRLAKWQLDHGTALIPERELGASPRSLSAVLGTRLIERRGNNLSFTLECVAQWFASQAIESGGFTTAEMVTDIARLERWQFALAIALNQAKEDTADRIMRPLAESQPAFASMVLRDGLRNWRTNDATREVPANEVSRRLTNAMAAWKIGLEPISSIPRIFPVDAQGNLLRIAATSDQGRFSADWIKEGIHSDSALDQEDCLGLGTIDRYWGGIIVDHPAWAWRTTHGMIKRSLEEVIEENHLAASSKIIAHEAAWAEGCRLLGESEFVCQRLPVSKLARQLHHGLSPWSQQQILYRHITTLIRQQLEFFDAPYPQSDQRPVGHRMAEYFSYDQTTKRAVAVNQAALLAYREAVEVLFPKMAMRFPRYAAWPFDLRGVVYKLTNSSSGFEGYVLSSFMDPSSPATPGHAYFVQGTKEEANLARSEWSQAGRSISPNRAPWHLQSWSESILSLWESRPATKIVKDWIKSDLKALGWA